jgi:hypothetical protein
LTQQFLGGRVNKQLELVEAGCPWKLLNQAGIWLFWLLNQQFLLKVCNDGMIQEHLWYGHLEVSRSKAEYGYQPWRNSCTWEHMGYLSAFHIVPLKYPRRAGNYALGRYYLMSCGFLYT